MSTAISAANSGDNHEIPDQMAYEPGQTTSYGGRDTPNTPYIGKSLADELSF
jgi:hypothetical protein